MKWFRATSSSRLTPVQAALAQQPWQSVHPTPLVIHGEPDPASTHCRYYPSLYDVPEAVCAVQTHAAWWLAWRYLQMDEVGLRQPLGVRVWAHVGRHSGRLLALEGEGWPQLDHVTGAFSQWQTQAARRPGAHREVMGEAWDQALAALMAARQRVP